MPIILYNYDKEITCNCPQTAGELFCIKLKKGGVTWHQVF